MDSDSESDSDYYPPKRHSKKPRRNSETDSIDYKIKQRCRSDSFFKSQTKAVQLDYINKEKEIYNFLDDTVPLRYKILNSSLSININSVPCIDCISKGMGISFSSNLMIYSCNLFFLCTYLD